MRSIYKNVEYLPDDVPFFKDCLSGITSLLLKYGCEGSDTVVLSSNDDMCVSIRSENLFMVFKIDGKSLELIGCNYTEGIGIKINEDFAHEAERVVTDCIMKISKFRKPIRAVFFTLDDNFSHLCCCEFSSNILVGEYDIYTNFVSV